MGILDELFRRKPVISVIGQQIGATLPIGMSVPEPLEELFCWIEENGFYEDTPQGRIGYLCPISYLREQRDLDGRLGGTEISFSAAPFPEMGYWFRNPSDEVKSNFCVISQTGGDGSVAAFWIDPDTRTQKIVHVGSGSGSVLQCVLADDAVDFLRLLAIGYDEICFADLSAPPPASGEFVVTPYKPFQTWVAETFKVCIPTIGSEIVRYPSGMDDQESSDPFWNWVLQTAWTQAEGDESQAHAQVKEPDA